MMWIFIILIVAIYLIFVFVEISCRTIDNVKFHDGGFLNMGYTTHSNRNPDRKDVLIAMIWPIILIIWFIKTTIWLINIDILPIPLLLFNIKYKKTKMFKLINKWTR